MSGCVGMDPSALLCPEARDAVMTTMTKGQSKAIIRRRLYN